MSDSGRTKQDLAAGGGGAGWTGLDDRSLAGDSSGWGARNGRGRWLGALVLLVGFIALSAGVMSTGRVGTGESADMVNYHVPVIRTFAQELPTSNLAKYDSATTPGYHLAMALVWKATGMDGKWARTPNAPVGAGPSAEWPAVELTPGERATWAAFIRDMRPMQILNIVLSAGLLMTVYGLASRFVAWWVALSLTLPLALNQYVLGASIWLTTDNIGWWLALSALASAMFLNCSGGAARAGAWATAAVLVRQVHLWVCGPILAAGVLAWLMGRRERGETQGKRALIASVFACAVPTIVVAFFVWLWGGLTPPSERIREVHGHGMNFAAVPFALSLLGAYGLAAFGAWRDQVGGLLRRPSVAVVAAGIGVVAAVVVATTTQQPTLTDPPMRGYGWLWKLSGMLPSAGERSLLLVAGAAFGALVLVMLMRAAAARGNSREALVLGIGLACWLAAQVVNPAAWQRYFDPIILAAVCWLAALGVPRGRQVSVAVGAVVLAVMMSGLSFRSVWRDLAENQLDFDGGVLKMQGKLGDPVKTP